MLNARLGNLGVPSKCWWTLGSLQLPPTSTWKKCITTWMRRWPVSLSPPTSSSSTVVSQGYVLHFNTVNHVMHLRRLQVSCGISTISGPVSNWCVSYLGGAFLAEHKKPKPAVLPCLVFSKGQPKVWFLFLLYIADLHSLIQIHKLRSRLLADDSSIYGSCHPSYFSYKVFVCRQLVIVSFIQQLLECGIIFHSWLRIRRR